MAYPQDPNQGGGGGGFLNPLLQALIARGQQPMFGPPQDDPQQAPGPRGSAGSAVQPGFDQSMFDAAGSPTGTPNNPGLLNGLPSGGANPDPWAMYG